MSRKAHPISRRTFLVGLGCAAAAARRARAADTAPGKTRPNILFAVADDASFPHLGAYGCTWVKTPGFDYVAQNGILFNNAYTPNAKCGPSRSCLLTGRNSWQLEAAANHWCWFPSKFKVYTEVLGEHGYHVGFTGKGWAPGKSLDAFGKPRNMTGKPYQKRTLTPPTRGISGRDYAAGFEDFLDEKPAGTPFCFWYGGFEPHRPYEYGTGAALGGKDPQQIEEVPACWPDSETTRNDMLDYAFEIEHFDQHLCRMLDVLKERGELENTLIVVTADNGMPFPRVKGQTYHPSNHLPLAIMWPAGIDGPGREEDTFVSFTDLAPTYLDLAGISWEESGMAPPEGKSLRHVLSSVKHASHRDHMLIGKERHDIGRPNDRGYPVRGLVTTDWLYIENFKPERWPSGDPETGYLNCDGSPTKTAILAMGRSGVDTRYWQQAFGKRPSEELFDLRGDPYCLNNLATRGQFRAVKKRLLEQMTRELTEQEDPRILGHGDVFDEYPYAAEQFQDYYGKYMRGGAAPEAKWVNEGDFETRETTGERVD